MISYHPLLQGAIELHCHSAPSVFARRQDDWELVEDIKAAGMAGVLIKSHESLTSDRATLLRTKEQGLQIYGGLVCNYFTGGLSPFAVDAAIRLGAKCIWMPTISSQEHFDHFAKKKTELFSSVHPVVQPSQGLAIWDVDKQLLPEVHQILDLIAEADIILATGHLSPPEVMALVAAARDHGVSKILVQHADLDIAPIPIDMQLELARQGAFIEKCYLACSAEFNFSISRMADSIRQLGAESCVMVTDYGQAHNVPVVEALSDFVGQVLDCGLSEAEVKQMISANPRQLLNI